jgi:thioredoxin reductase
MFMEETVLKSGKILKSDGIFVAIGSDPNTSLVDDFDLQKDEE